VKREPLVVPFLAAVVSVALSAPAIAETRGAVLLRLCADAAHAEQLWREAREADAVGDSNSYKVYREAARLYFRCSETVSKSELRDLALLSYGNAIYASTRTNGDALKIDLTLDAKLNELAYRSRFEDLRTDARELRRLVRHSYREAYKAVYGTYPEDWPELEPASMPAPNYPEFKGPTTLVTPTH